MANILTTLGEKGAEIDDLKFVAPFAFRKHFFWLAIHFF